MPDRALILDFDGLIVDTEMSEYGRGRKFTRAKGRI